LDVGSTLLEYRPVRRLQAWAEISNAEPDAIDAAWRTARGAARPLSGYETLEEYEAFRADVCSRTLDAVGFDGHRQSAIAAMSDAWVRVGWEPYPDVLPALSALRADGYRIGVISNWTATLELTLAHVGLAEFFDVVACSALVGAMKPDPRIFQHALGALEVEPARALFVGDHCEVDVLGARDAGMAAVRIVRDETADVAADPTTLLTLHDLRSILDARN
jgi:putative hydrolase of the HAD superfamily